MNVCTRTPRTGPAKNLPRFDFRLANPRRGREGFCSVCWLKQTPNLRLRPPGPSKPHSSGSFWRSEISGVVIRAFWAFVFVTRDNISKMLYDGKFHCFAFEPKFFLSLICSYKNNMILNFFNVLLFSQSSILASDLYNLLEACWPCYFWIFAPTSVITKGKALLQTGWIIRIFEEGNPSGSDNLGTRGQSETKPLDVYFLNLYVNSFAITPRI